MPKSVKEVASELNDMLRLKGEPVMTLTWPEFYGLSQMERFKEPRPQQIKDEAKGQWHLIVEYGQNVVVVCHDRNFSPKP
jgi:hypothetical protein